MSSRSAIALALVASLAALPVYAAEYRWPVTRVVDGDTIEVDLPGLPPELARVKVQVRGVDAPETATTAKCPKERKAGEAAADLTKALIAGADEVTIRDPVWDKWGGRIQADVLIDGRLLARALIEAGHGRPYQGGKREGWCE